MRGRIKKEAGLQVYLKQISVAPLLSADEERELAVVIRRAQELGPTVPDSRESLAKKEEADRDAVLARDSLVKSNLRLVVNIAKRYARRGMPLTDLIEEGNIGLIRAVEGYDPDHSTRFSTYASWWIKQAIKRSLINSRQPIHIPAYMVEMVSRFKKATAHFADQGRQPTPAELAKFMRVPEGKVQMIHRAVTAMNSASQASAEESDVLLSDMLPDKRTPMPEAALFSESDVEVVQRLLERIDEREAIILRLRFGLDGSEPKTLKEIGVEVGLTRERVRQLQDEALGKLKEALEDE